MINADVSPSSPVAEQPTIGLIGMGAMGRMYARLLSDAGWKKIHVCDLPEKFDVLKRDFADVPGVVPMKDGHAVSRSSDFIVYSVEAEFIDRIVAEYGPSTKVNAIVAGQTSVKAPEKTAFENHLPPDTHIISCHSLHGPTVSPVGQPLVLIQHRAPDEALHLVKNILRPFGSRFVYLSYEDHDLVTANTQAVTHAAFLSMGTAWSSEKEYPWEQGRYVGGLETAKVNITLRIYSNAWHVYAGLAILNPSARVQIDQYALSTTELFKLMLEGGTGGETGAVSEQKFRERVQWAKKTVFGHETTRKPILLSQEVLDNFSLGKVPEPSSDKSLQRYKPNSHLSLLAMVDCWAHLGIQPFHHLALAATPLFRLFLGVAEHLFLNEELLDQSLCSALHDTWHRANDLEFVVASRGWSQCVSFGSFEIYKRRFETSRRFFEGRFEEANILGSEMLKAIMASEIERERSQ